MAEFLSPGLYDHSPIILRLKVLSNAGPKPFRFYNHWCRNESFISMTRRIWQTSNSTNPMENLYANLSILKKELRALGQQEIKEVHDVQLLKEQIAMMQQEILNGRATPLVTQQEIEARTRVAGLMNREEAVLRQKSRVQWLSLGDQNNQYFHKTIKCKQARNTIRSIVSKDEITCGNLEEIKTIIVNYF